jgi:serine/threonine protein kinase
MAELYIMRPLFPGASELDQLMKLSSVLGTPNEMDWPGGFHLAEQRGYTFPQYVTTPLNVILPMASQVALGVLTELLQWNPSRRPTAEDALRSPFFAECALESPHHSIFPDGDHIESTEEMIRSQRTQTSVNRQSPSPRVSQGARQIAASPVPVGKIGIGTQAKGKNSVFAGVVGKQPTALAQIGLGRHKF